MVGSGFFTLLHYSPELVARATDWVGGVVLHVDGMYSNRHCCEKVHCRWVRRLLTSD